MDWFPEEWISYNYFKKGDAKQKKYSGYEERTAEKSLTVSSQTFEKH